MLPNFAYVRPTSLDETVEHLSEPGARLHAGGTDLIGCLRDEVFAAASVVSLSSVAGLDGIAEAADGGLRLGSMVRVAQLAADARVRSRFRALSDAAAVVATPQLRAQAPSAATSARSRAAGTTAASFTACARAATSASRCAARTTSTASWAATAATSCTRRTWRPRWSRSRRSRESAARRAAGSFRSRGSTSRRRSTPGARRCSRPASS
jgi:CO/xanthine dehydrogenase FAD-binding subunit